MARRIRALDDCMVRTLAAVAFVIVVIVYAAPSVIAILRAHRRWLLVVAIDILLGWTIAGWLVALAMSLDLRLRAPKRRRKARAEPVSAVCSPEKGDAPAAHAAPARLHADPPEIRDDSYQRWLDGGAAMNT